MPRERGREGHQFEMARVAGHGGGMADRVVAGGGEDGSGGDDDFGADGAGGREVVCRE